ncbi:MAG: aminopeptidase P family protein [Actinomycetia bacterium]|nr:aminopeptidase P family protein [Actinomycetes bacterium]
MNADARLAALRRRLKDEELPSMLVTTVSNMRYITGFDTVFDSGINAACLVTSERARFYTDKRYSEAAEVAAVGTPWQVRVPEDDLYVEVCRELQAEGVTQLTLESAIPYGRFTFISEQFVGSVRVTDHLIEEIRQIKSASEIERIQAAAAITDAAFDYICGFVRPGMTEREVGLELEYWMRTHGSQGLAFDPIVASGPNSARPHAGVSDRVIERGDFLKLDFGARVGGYCSDMTRTVVIGTASERQREVHAAVLEANRAGVAAVKPGMVGKDVHAVARKTLDDLGLGEYFTHGLGHGVGLDVHELPGVGAKSRDSLRVGSVITIEPGVYMPGFGGVRIEDLVVVDEGGARVLSTAPRELIEI